ncbi:Aromatase WhiE VI [Actinacidiphila bryophytorum]|uniref:Aromatase WhiE VI n=1 Tax=Actinacidiphila bryophytorum TaxID=1436133 RepID=A0A9W4GZ31_9ACTN|nr:Aromatase WhiE VI [Actinacidiphila bryophytorum]
MGHDERPGALDAAVQRVRVGGDPGAPGPQDHLPADDAPGRERQGVELGLRARAGARDPYGHRPPRRDRSLRLHGDLLELPRGPRRHPDALGPGLRDEAGRSGGRRGHDRADQRELRRPAGADQGQDRAARPRAGRGRQLTPCPGGPCLPGLPRTRKQERT